MGLLDHRLVGRVRPGIAVTLESVEPFRVEWETSNAAALAGSGPLWLARTSRRPGSSAPRPTAAFVLAFLVGYAYFVVIISLSTVLQEYVADEIRGRVVALWIMGFGGTVPLGVLVGGVVAHATSLTAVLLAGAVVAVALSRYADLSAVGAPAADGSAARPAGGPVPLSPASSTRRRRLRSRGPRGPVRGRGTPRSRSRGRGPRGR